MINVHQCSSIITPKFLVLFVVLFWFSQHSDDCFQLFRVAFTPGGKKLMHLVRVFISSLFHAPLLFERLGLLFLLVVLYCYHSQEFPSQSILLSFLLVMCRLALPVNGQSDTPTNIGDWLAGLADNMLSASHWSIDRRCW